MICLTLDTAGTACAACLYDSARDVVLAEISEDIGKGHAERLMGVISNVMTKAKVTYQDIGRVITTTGPGSFTGIRVGVATARGFGVGLNIPVVGISNLEAILDEFTADRIGGSTLQRVTMLGVAMNAGRGQAYCLFNFATALKEANRPFVADIEDIREALASLKQPFLLCGSAASAMIEPESTNPASSHARTYANASIGVVARLGAKSSATAKKPEPLYLRKPDAVAQKGFAVERRG